MLGRGGEGVGVCEEGIGNRGEVSVLGVDGRFGSAENECRV